ncbi:MULTISPECIES: hypothetical protein [unclassified Archaeoglobus]|jgi:hypothetical protein|uniref:hypothetical protein n=1 Tax=unclassified Archaeoglobus TaxID=2643606 RepID=UPI0025C6A32A|nr:MULTISPECIES: hypothetical protein [unclassified Archaeoglobus]
MGRIALILLFPFIAAVVNVSAFDFSYTCNKEFGEYYFGGEYLYFYCTLRPDSNSDAENMAGVSYKILSALDSAVIQVEVKFEDGKVLLHPAPEDEYSAGNATSLGFYVPKLDKIDEIVMRIQGYVPVPDSRLENITVLSAYADEKLFIETITVVNKQKFYDDIRSFSKSDCADKNKLEEAEAYFNDGKYLKADSLMDEIETNVIECALNSEKEKYEEILDSIKEKFNELKKDLMVFELTVERDAAEIENYDEVVNKLAELKSEVTAVEGAIDNIEDFIRDAKFKEADDGFDYVDSKIMALQQNLTELENSIKKKSFDWVLIVAIGAAIVVVAVALLILRGREGDKW